MGEDDRVHGLGRKEIRESPRAEVFGLVVRMDHLKTTTWLLEEIGV